MEETYETIFYSLNRGAFRAGFAFTGEVLGMKYAELKEIMTEFRLNHITRTELVAAFALWQRPVEIARLDEIKRRLAIHFQVPFNMLWPGQKDPGDNYKLALEAVIR